VCFAFYTSLFCACQCISSAIWSLRNIAYGAGSGPDITISVWTAQIIALIRFGAWSLSKILIFLDFQAFSQNCEKRLLASSCLSVCSSVRMEQLISHWRIWCKCDRASYIYVRKMYQLDANNFIMILSHKWTLHVSDIYMSIFRSSYIQVVALTDKQCTRLHTNSAGPQPQHLWHNTTCGSATTCI